jgi:hypothetical protein
VAGLMLVSMVLAKPPVKPTGEDESASVSAA